MGRLGFGKPEKPKTLRRFCPSAVVPFKVGTGQVGNSRFFGPLGLALTRRETKSSFLLLSLLPDHPPARCMAAPRRTPDDPLQ